MHLHMHVVVSRINIFFLIVIPKEESHIDLTPDIAMQIIESRITTTVTLNRLSAWCQH